MPSYPELMQLEAFYWIKVGFVLEFFHIQLYYLVLGINDFNPILGLRSGKIRLFHHSLHAAFLRDI